MHEDTPNEATVSEKDAVAIAESCQRLLADRYGVPERRWVIDPSIHEGSTRVDGVEHWLGSCVLSGVGFGFDMFCTPDRRTGDVLLFDHRTRLAVADKVALSAALDRGGASLDGILDRREA